MTRIDACVEPAALASCSVHLPSPTDSSETHALAGAGFSRSLLTVALPRLGTCLGRSSQARSCVRNDRRPGVQDEEKNRCVIQKAGSQRAG